LLNLTLKFAPYIRNTFSKRKLTTKVLLPKTLEIPSNSTTEGRAKYVLCAVQNHLGSSAHGGHYIADVMDWISGVWYEFNDEDVTILNGGPTSSFKPSEKEDGSDSNLPNSYVRINGSQDAYNLLYVQQSYLSDQCQNFIKRATSTEASVEDENDDDVMASVIVQRQKRYENELE